MRKKEYKLFLRQLIEKSKARQIKWRYLDSNVELCRGIKLYQEPLSSKTLTSSGKFCFNVESSYYVGFPKENMFVALIVKTDLSDVALHIIPNTFKNVLVLSFSDYGDLITRLANIIKLQLPNPEDFIDSYLSVMRDRIQE